MSTTIEQTEMTDEEAAMIAEADDLTKEAAPADTSADEPEPAAEATEADEPTDNTPEPAGVVPGLPDAATWHEIEEARRSQREAEMRVLMIAEELKTAKKTLEGRTERLGELIDKANEPTLWNQLKAAETQGTLAEVIEEQPVEREAWRAVRLATLEPAIKPRTLSNLADHEPSIQTLGDLADWQSLKGDWWAEDIKGLGKAGIQQIEDATAAYWAANPLPADGDQPVPASDEATVDPDGGLPIVDAADVGLADFDFAANTHPHLLTPMHCGTAPDLAESCPAIDGIFHVVIREEQEGVFLLKRLGPVDESIQIDKSGAHADAYVGGIVLALGQEQQIQPMKHDRYVRAAR